MNEYDALIVANSPGGWLAAIALAQAGRKVAILDQVRVSPAGLIPRGGLLFQIFPALEQGIRRESQLFQFAAPGHRFSIITGHNHLLSELGFEFPELKDGLEQTLSRIHDSGRATSDYFRIWRIENGRPDYRTLDGKLFENLSLWRHFQRVRRLSPAGLNQGISRSPDLCRILETPGRFSSALAGAEDDEGMGAFSAYHRQAFFPLFSPQEAKAGLVGLREVVAALRRIGRELKIEILNPAPAGPPDDSGPAPAEEGGRFEFTSRRWLKKANPFHFWEKKGEEKKAGFRGLIWSGNGPEFLKSLPEKLRKSRGAKSLARRLDILKARYFPEELEIRVRAEVIPVGMENRVFLLGEAGREPADENLIYLELLPDRAGEPEQEEPRYAGAGASLLIRAGYLRSVSRSPEEVSERVVQRISGLIPFLEDFMLSAPVRKKDGGAVAGETPVWHNHRGLHQGSLYVPAGNAGIYYSGRELLPVLGAEADLLSGLATAWSLEKWLRKITK